MTKRENHSLKVCKVETESRTVYIVALYDGEQYQSPLTKKKQKATGCHTAVGNTLKACAYYADTFKSYSGAYGFLKRLED